MNSKLQANSSVINALCFKGKKTYDENGKVNSDCQSLKIEYGTMQYKHTLTHLLSLGFTDVEVLSIEGDPQHESIKEVQAEFNKVLKPSTEIDPKDLKIQELSGEVAELKKMVEDMLQGKQVAQPPVSNDELEAVRDEYFQLIGEKPHHKAGIEKLREEIEAFKNK